MRINPQTIRWGRVTERVDGSSIPGEIDYTLGVVVDEAVEPLLVLPGALQPDNTYLADLGNMSFDPGIHTIALRATEQATGLTSEWSNAVTFEIVNAAPRAPFGVAVE